MGARSIKSSLHPHFPKKFFLPLTSEFLKSQTTLMNQKSAHDCPRDFGFLGSKFSPFKARLSFAVLIKGRLMKFQLSLTHFQNCSFLYPALFMLRSGRKGELKRSRFDIMAEIVQYCLSPRRKTQIMLRGNLAFSQTNAYLEQLIASKLILPHKANYRTTSKGQEFLLFYGQLIQLLRESPSQTEKRESAQDATLYLRPLITQTR